MPWNKADVSPSSPQFPGAVDRHDQEANVSETHAGGMAPRIVWDVYRPAATFVGTRSPFPVVLVHGANHSAAIYAQWGQYLATLGITVYAIDLRGHGRSTMPPGEAVSKAHLWQYVEDIATLVQTEDLTNGQFILAGHSLGGAVVQLYALTQPVAGLIIVASTALPRFLSGFLTVARHAPLTYVQAMLLGPQHLFNSAAKIRRFLLEPDADDAIVQRVQA